MSSAMLPFCFPDGAESLSYSSGFGLASALDQFGADDDQAKANRLYTNTIEMRPSRPIAEMAREARSRFAQKHMRGAAAGAPGMDAVTYCLGALEKFETMRPDELVDQATEGELGYRIVRNCPHDCDVIPQQIKPQVARDRRVHGGLWAVQSGSYTGK